MVGPSGEKFVVYVLGESLEKVQYEITQLVLENNGFNRTHTAQALGINIRTLRHWIQKGYVSDSSTTKG